MDRYYSNDSMHKFTKKNKFLTRFTARLYSLAVLLALVFTAVISAQPKYSMSLSDPLIVSENAVEFEVYIKCIDKSFDLTSYQCAFQFNPKITNNGRLKFSYVAQSSQIANAPRFGVSVNHVDNYMKLAFASLVGSDVITKDNLRIGRFRLENTKSFATNDLGLKWSFDGDISTILTSSDFAGITNVASHFYEKELNANSTLKKNSVSNTNQTEYKLFQNYPNPFNPETNITFNLPKDGEVKIAVFNVLGQEIKVLLEGTMPAGTHSIEFLSEELSSGIYFCKLIVNNKYTDIIKMILTR